MFKRHLTVKLAIVIAIGTASAQTFTPIGDAELDREKWLKTNVPPIYIGPNCNPAFLGSQPGNSAYTPSVAGVLWPTLVQIQTLLSGYSGYLCITGGSEPGGHHTSPSGTGHADGFKVDLEVYYNQTNNFADQLSTWILLKGSNTTCRTDDGAPQYDAASGVRSALEYPSPPWTSTSYAGPPNCVGVPVGQPPPASLNHWDIRSSFAAITSPWDGTGLSVEVGQTVSIAPVAKAANGQTISLRPFMFSYDSPYDPGYQLASIDTYGGVTGVNTNADGTPASINIFVSAGGSTCTNPDFCAGTDVLRVTVSANNPPEGGSKCVSGIIPQEGCWSWDPSIGGWLWNPGNSGTGGNNPPGNPPNGGQICSSSSSGPCWQWDPTANGGAGAWIFVPQGGGSSDDETTSPITPVGSLDPNGISGPVGVGAAQYIAGASPEPYMIFFENESTATAPAQKVVVTDVVDPTRFDLSSLVLGPITFPGIPGVAPPSFPVLSTGFSTQVDLRPTVNLLVNVTVAMNVSSGLLTWTLQSIDPSTGLPPVDPLIGFLPPNGNGSVSFTVRLKPTLTTGTTVTDQATITFDANSPLSTSVWSNTLDITRPTSRVAALPASEPTAAFPVSWAGTDVGSGIRDYSVYVSDSGGAYVPWVWNSALTSQKFIGTTGHTYSFYSISRDLVGNVESSKSIAEATTTIATKTPTIQCTGCYFVSNGLRATLAFNVASAGSPSTFSYNYRTSTQTVQFASTATSQISVNGSTATFSGQGKLNGQTGYSFTVIAKDGGAVGSGLDTVSISITGPNNYSYTVNGTIAGGDIVVKQ